IRATPEKLPLGQKPGAPAQFDMTLISLGSRTPHLGTLDVGQVRMIFRLPRQFGKDSRPLAYIELFTPLRVPDPSSQMRQLLHST
ncbi:hypothetical protein BDR04DRAFT_949580, partial [Suillus decipiens]